MYCMHHYRKIKTQSKTDLPICQQCPQERPAGVVAWKCLDCNVNLCDMCQSQHKKLPILRGVSQFPVFNLNVSI